ncbi:MAG: hypothetical protein KF708_01745 [Pirellulales bacterium]|nr:hypothetical protein [Pirellulales bacterium]
MSGHLNAFERYMLADDRASHPMTFTVRMKLAGRFDVDVFRRAVRQALARHPLLCSRVVGTGRAATWMASESEVLVDVAELDQDLRFPGQEKIDLQHELPVRLWVRSSGTETEVRAQFHHSATDGIGAYRFLEDTLCAYDAEVRGTAPAWRPVLVEKLARRARFGLAWWQVLLRLPQELWGVVVGMAMFLLPRPASLRSGPHVVVPADERRELLNYPTHTFTVDETKQLRETARGAGATLNDLLLRDLFLTMQAWSDARGLGRARQLFRIMMPVNLRTADDDDLPAANVVAMVFLDRHLGLFHHPALLLKSIKLETWFLKTFRFGLAFVRSCALIGSIRGGLEFMTRDNRCYATTVLSNMGQVMTDVPLPRQNGKIVAGELVLEAIESAPPVRPFTSMAITPVTYAGRMALVLNYDRERFSAAEAQAFLSLYVQQLHAAAGITVTLPTTLEPALAA